jgi:hypothetical protein
MNKEKTYKDSQTWESVLKLIDNKYINSEELILKQDEPITVLFRGQPFCYEAVWQDPKWVLYDPNYTAHKNVNPALRILINVAVIDEDILYSKYFEMDVTTFKDLVKFREKYGLYNWTYSLVSRDNDPIEQCVDIVLYEEIDNDLKNQIDGFPMICLSSVVENLHRVEEDLIKEHHAQYVKNSLDIPYPAYSKENKNSAVSPYDLSAVAKYNNSSKYSNGSFEKPCTTDSPYDLSAVAKYRKRKR